MFILPVHASSIAHTNQSWVSPSVYSFFLLLLICYVILVIFFYYYYYLLPGNCLKYLVGFKDIYIPSLCLAISCHLLIFIGELFFLICCRILYIKTINTVSHIANIFSCAITLWEISFSVQKIYLYVLKYVTVFDFGFQTSNSLVHLKNFFKKFNWSFSILYIFFT